MSVMLIIILCSVCQNLKAYPNNCPYKLQFKDMPKTVFLPIEYAGSKVLEDYRPQIIAVDDCLLRKKEHPTRAKLDFYVKYFSNNKYNLEDLCKMEHSTFEDVLTNEIKLSDDEITRWVVEHIKTNPENKLVISRITEPEELRAYYRYAKIYGMKDRFATPYLFYLFLEIEIIKFKEIYPILILSFLSLFNSKNVSWISRC